MIRLIILYLKVLRYSYQKINNLRDILHFVSKYINSVLKYLIKGILLQCFEKFSRSATRIYNKKFFYVKNSKFFYVKNSKFFYVKNSRN